VGFQGRPDRQGAAGRSVKRIRQLDPRTTNPVDISARAGGGLAGRKDEYVKECFKDLPSPKDGYSIDDCKDPQHRRLLAFLVPIVYPEKPNRITVTWGNTIFGALNGGRKVNWVRVITTLVIQLAAQVGKSRATPICPFFYHLYERKELLKPEEEKTWKI
jgi:hypothetical protein